MSGSGELVQLSKSFKLTAFTPAKIPKDWEAYLQDIKEWQKKNQLFLKELSQLIEKRWDECRGSLKTAAVSEKSRACYRLRDLESMSEKPSPLCFSFSINEKSTYWTEYMVLSTLITPPYDLKELKELEHKVSRLLASEIPFALAFGEYNEEFRDRTRTLVRSENLSKLKDFYSQLKMKDSKKSLRWLNFVLLSAVEESKASLVQFALDSGANPLFEYHYPIYHVNADNTTDQREEIETPFELAKGKPEIEKLLKIKKN